MELRALLCRHVSHELNASLGSLLRGIYSSVLVIDDVAMESVLEIAVGRLAKKKTNVGFVVAKKAEVRCRRRIGNSRRASGARQKWIRFLLRSEWAWWAHLSPMPMCSETTGAGEREW